MAASPRLDGTNLNPIHPQYCDLVQRLNDPMDPCNSATPTDPSRHPCQPNNEMPEPPAGGPGGVGEGQLEDYIEDYDVVENHWDADGFGSGPIGPQCTYQCISTTDNYGHTSEQCQYVCTSSSQPFTKSDSNSAMAGVGPRIGISSPSEGSVVAGRLRIEGFVKDFVPIDAFYVTIDGIGIDPVESWFGLASAIACSETHSNGHFACDSRSGYRVDVDLSQVANGLHTLAIISWNMYGWITSHEIEIDVQNYSEPTPPAIAVLRSWDSIAIENGGTYAFGERPIQTLPVVAEFLVCNQGETTLQLGSTGNLVEGVGFSQGCCGPVTSLPQGQCSRLKVRFDVDQPGTYTGTVSVPNNDPDDSPFTFSLSGEAISTTSAPPRLNIDLPVPNEVLAGSILVSGWALDDGNLTDSNIAVRVDGNLVALSGFTYGSSRTDVCAGNVDLDSPNCPNVGWSGWLDTGPLPDGAHQLAVTVNDATNNSVTQTRWFSSEHQPQGQAPLIWIAFPGHNEVVSGSVPLSGWVLAETSLEAEDLRFYLDGRPILPGSPFYGVAMPWVCNARPDLPAPDCPNVGWRANGHSSAISNGQHTLQLFVQDRSGNLSVFTRSFFVQN